MDQHVEVLLNNSVETEYLLLEVLGTEDPRAEVESRIDAGAKRICDAFGGYDPLGVLEVIRMATLPIAPVGVIPPAAQQSGPAISEILTIALLCSSSERDSRRVDQELCGLVGAELIPLARELLNLAAVREILAADEMDALEHVAGRVRGNGRWLRGTSYPEMQAAVLRGLFGEPAIDAQLRAILDFGVDDALFFLEECHRSQVDQLNARGQAFADMLSTIDTSRPSAPTDDEKQVTHDAFTGLFNPTGHQAAVFIDDVAARAGLSAEVGRRIAAYFASSAVTGNPQAAVRAHLDGNSPLRKHPLVANDDLVMVIHPALIGEAVKSAFEDVLKKSDHWDGYAAHRGQYLEYRIGELFHQLIPGVIEHKGFSYLVPADESEARGTPDAYTKRVEGDHLFVLDDVAFIVEDKAVPLNDRARTGQLGALRRNLVAAITKGAQQAGRMKRRIVEDQGLRFQDGTWLDLADVREIHSVVTSLDDMPGIATASTTLAKAGLLDPADMPWTVSLNDLDLIAQLVDRPAEFLLYLRRRTDPRATEMFMATDELDLFLFFFQMGLYVEPDPSMASREMPWRGKPRTADVRRFNAQQAGIVTSHTDALDAWYYSLHPQAGVTPDVVAPKPQMTPSPLEPLIDWLRGKGLFGWLSIGATLLDGSADAQRRLAAHTAGLVSNPDPTGKPRSLAVPWGLTSKDSWLLVWMTRPEGLDVEYVLRRAHAYMVAKKHQLSHLRGATFVLDEPSGSIVGASYDSGQMQVDPRVLADAVASLRQPGDVETRAQMTQRLRARERRSNPKRRRR